MDDFEARRKMNEIKTKVGQEARANPPAASPVRVPVYPHPVFAVVCGFFNGIGAAFLQGFSLFAFSNFLTHRSMSIHFEYNTARYYPTPLFLIESTAILIISCLWSGYVVARLSAKFRLVFALGLGLLYTVMLIMCGARPWQWAIPPLVCLVGALVTRLPAKP
jgi:hypothetical protein